MRPTTTAAAAAPRWTAAPPPPMFSEAQGGNDPDEQHEAQGGNNPGEQHYDEQDEAQGGDNPDEQHYDERRYDEQSEKGSGGGSGDEQNEAQGSKRYDEQCYDEQRYDEQRYDEQNEEGKSGDGSNSPDQKEAQGSKDQQYYEEHGYDQAIARGLDDDADLHSNESTRSCSWHSWDRCRAETSAPQLTCTTSSGVVRCLKLPKAVVDVSHGAFGSIRKRPADDVDGGTGDEQLEHLSETKGAGQARDSEDSEKEQQHNKPGDNHSAEVGGGSTHNEGDGADQEHTGTAATTKAHGEELTAM
eukprot:15485023-Alexandrium_andersonii.AAC.1